MKKLICCMMVGLMAFGFTGCGEKETVKTEAELKAEVKAEMEAEMEAKKALKEEIRAELEAEMAGESKTKEETQKDTSIKDDEIITTYAYPNIDDVDVSSLKKVVFDSTKAMYGNKANGNISEFKIAFFGEVSNIQINCSEYIFEDFGKKIGNYDILKDTLLIIRYDESFRKDGFHVFFEDGRGIESYFYLSEVDSSKEKVELVSGLTAMEKTPSPYPAYDMSDFIKCIGMTTNEFEDSTMMQYAKMEIQEGMDNSINVYMVNDLITGVKIEFLQSEEEDIISSCLMNIDEEIYNNLSDEDKYSFFGIDFDMTVVRANHHMIKPDGLKAISVYGGDPSVSSRIHMILLTNYEVKCNKKI